MLPIIDLATSNDVGADVDHALRETGFLQLTGLGIPQALVDSVFSVSRSFFNEPESVKRECGYRSAEENFGYQALLTENLDPNSPADVKESFTMRNIVAQPPASERWPSPQFKRVMMCFFEEVLAAAHRVQQQMAIKLGLEENFFVNAHSGRSCSLRLLHYPVTKSHEVAQRQLGAGAHTDYGFMTLLFQESVAGLEVRDAEGCWLSVPPVYGAAVVNSGDLLERWTNGAYRSTVHRVVPMVGEASRLSIAMFIDPDPDTQVAVLPSCISDQNPSRYPTITAGEHLQEKLQATHKGRFKK